MTAFLARSLFLSGVRDTFGREPNVLMYSSSLQNQVQIVLPDTHFASSGIRVFTRPTTGCPGASSSSARTSYAVLGGNGKLSARARSGESCAGGTTTGCKAQVCICALAVHTFVTFSACAASKCDVVGFDSVVVPGRSGAVYAVADFIVTGGCCDILRALRGLLPLVAVVVACGCTRPMERFNGCVMVVSVLLVGMRDGCGTDGTVMPLVLAGSSERVREGRTVNHLIILHTRLFLVPSLMLND
jgi:hypothetical protein